MSLRAKTALIIALTTAALVGALHVVLGALMLGSFEELETIRTQDAVIRAASALDNELEQLDVKLSDWASWDASYEYVVTPSDEYERENLLPAALSSLRLEMILIFDAGGGLVNGVRLADGGESLAPVAEDVAALVRSVLRFEECAPVRGMLSIEGLPALIAARPVLRSDTTGPARGVMAFVRPVTADTVAHLGRLTRLRLTINPGAAPAAAPAGADDLTEAVELGAVPITVERLSAKLVRGRTVLPDLTGRSSLELAVEGERQIYSHGRSALRWLVASLLVAGTVFGVVIVISLGHSVLHRVRRLSEEVQRIASSDTLEGRVAVQGGDEIASLARRINEMLESLDRARLAAEAASRAKSDFLANMSHEIRTPVTAMLGFADLLADESAPARERPELAQTLRRNGEHLLAIINDILDLARIEAGRLSIQTDECDPMTVARDVIDAVTPRARAAGLSLAFEAVGPIPARIRTDPTRLHQVLLNLVGNAVKFTRDGGVRVIVKLVTRPDDALPLLRYEVIDTGPGMNASLRARLFEPFTQGDESATRRFGGTGLGLTISRRLARAMGGDLVVVWSEPGRGSLFAAMIATGPLNPGTMADALSARASAQTVSSAPAVTPIEGRILLAEDGPDNRRLLTYMLTHAGATVVCAEDGRQAIDAALQSLRAGEPFDLILMDMQMPEVDGYAASLELRAKGWSGPIVALTAHAMNGDRGNCIAAGCDDYATKPITGAALSALCALWLQRGRARRAA